MKTLTTILLFISSTMAVGTASAQNAGMMNRGYGGMWGGDWMGGSGGYWVPVLLVAVVGLVVWVVMQKRK